MARLCNTDVIIVICHLLLASLIDIFLCLLAETFDQSTFYIFSSQKFPKFKTPLTKEMLGPAHKIFFYSFYYQTLSVL